MSTFPALELVDGNIGIEAVGLADVAGFNALTSAAGVNIQFNPSLVSISGFAAITFLGNLIIQNDPLLETVTGFASLETVLYLVITNNELLTDLPGVRAAAGGSIDHRARRAPARRRPAPDSLRPTRSSRPSRRLACSRSGAIRC